MLIGGGGLIAATAVLASWRAIETGMVLTDDAAFDPWQAWKQTAIGDPYALVAAAILASSPHNTQPWLFKVTDRHIDVRADPNRNLGAMDPFRREKWIGLGAAIANIEIAAPARGFVTRVQLLPEASDPDLAARIFLQQGRAVPTALAAEIDQRRTNRSAYDRQRDLPASVIDSLLALDDDSVRTVWLPATGASGTEFARETLAATRLIVADEEMSHDGHQWFRSNPREVRLHRDGVATPTSGIPAWLARISPLVPPVDAAGAGQYWLRSTERQLATAPRFGLILVRDLYDRKLQLLAGMRWQRMHLMLTAEGLAAHPMNQLVEVVDRDRQLKRHSATAQTLQAWTGRSEWRATFAFRTGYATQAMPHSARRGLAAVTVS